MTSSYLSEVINSEEMLVIKMWRKRCEMSLEDIDLPTSPLLFISKHSINSYILHSWRQNRAGTHTFHINEIVPVNMLWWCENYKFLCFQTLRISVGPTALWKPVFFPNYDYVQWHTSGLAYYFLLTCFGHYLSEALHTPSRRTVMKLSKSI